MYHQGYRKSCQDATEPFHESILFVFTRKEITSQHLATKDLCEIVLLGGSEEHKLLTY